MSLTPQSDWILSGSGDLAAWASVVLTAVAAVAAGYGFFYVRARERREALAALHASLTSGETAVARNTIGTLLHGGRRDRPSRLDCIQSYFALIWSLQRARNVFRAHNLHWKTLQAPNSRVRRAARGGRPDEATIALTWNLREIAENVVMFHDRYSTSWSVEDDDAWTDVSEFVEVETMRE